MISLKQSLTVFVPECTLGDSDLNHRHAKTRPKDRVYAWLGLVDVFKDNTGYTSRDVNYFILSMVNEAAQLSTKITTQPIM
jgi:hypothetical protein